MSSKNNADRRAKGRKPGKALRRALLDRFPAARALDTRLAVDGERLADFAFEDGDRLWLVLREKRLDGRTAELVRATMGRARTLGPLLARALGSDAEDVRVMLVVKHLVEGGRDALADSLADGAVLVRRRKLRGAETSRWLLERLAGELEPATVQAIDERTRAAVHPPTVAGLPPGPARFVASLTTDHAPLAAELIRRQLRLDSELRCEGDEHGLVWLRAEEVLCTLHAGHEGLECRLSGIGVPRLISEAEELEEWLDFLLAQYFERWPAGEGPEPSFEIPRPDAGGWLSPAEYEAFRDAGGTPPA